MLCDQLGRTAATKATAGDALDDRLYATAADRHNAANWNCNDKDDNDQQHRIIVDRQRESARTIADIRLHIRNAVRDIWDRLVVRLRENGNEAR